MTGYFILNHASLKRYNTLRLDVVAHTLVMPHTVEGLVSALRDFNDRKIVVIGNGSNIFFSKEYYDESHVFVLTNLINDIEYNGTEIICEAGTRMHRLAWFACEQSLGELAFTEDIPGTLGGGLFMNAGQWKQTIGQYVNWIEVYNIEKDEVQRLIPDEDFFAYRYSKLNNLPVYVLRCGIKAVPGNYEEVLAKMLDYRHERYVKQPRNFANAGSVFKRPKDKEGNSLFVWKLFDEVELRGFRIGDALVSEKHPGFIVNAGNAKVDDISAVIAECKKRVKDTFDVDLELEWRVI
ncbi:MAG: UDP-N-acetylmuramate dehydrogenase [Erysipelothrix sp.]|nr:UDP-N-acetylmuramate dehydrogenase [Erysipelothrix sp.]